MLHRAECASHQRNPARVICLSKLVWRSNSISPTGSYATAENDVSCSSRNQLKEFEIFCLRLFTTNSFILSFLTPVSYLPLRLMETLNGMSDTKSDELAALRRKWTLIENEIRYFLWS
jgi:hypothetical protein